MSKIIGIDLGTTNSCLAIVEGQQPKVIENLEEQDLVTNPTIRTQGSQKQNSKVNSEPDTDDQSVWGHVKKYYKKFMLQKYFFHDSQ